MAPHGAEQLALYLAVASRHDLVHIQGLSHCPYGTKVFSDAYPGEFQRTPPDARYLDAGFKDTDFKDPTAEPFTSMFHEYLRQFVSLFGEDSSLLGMSASSEGDWVVGPDRVNDTYRFVAARDPNHVFLTEPINEMDVLPEELCFGFEPSLRGSRTYWIADEVFPEIDLGIEYKLLRTVAGAYVAEGSWPNPTLHRRLHEIFGDGRSNATWIGSKRYRLRLRDTLYLGLVHSLPLFLTWDEAVAEDEHRVFDEARRRVDWGKTFAEAPVALLVDSTNVLGEGRLRLAEYERYFTSVPLACRYVTPGDPVPSTAGLVIDARVPFRIPVLEDSLAMSSPIATSEGFGTSYAWTEDRTTLLAYICNASGHVEREAEWSVDGTVSRSRSSSRSRCATWQRGHCRWRSTTSK